MTAACILSLSLSLSLISSFLSFANIPYRTPLWGNLHAEIFFSCKEFLEESDEKEKKTIDEILRN